VQAKNMEVYSALAIVPEQTIDTTSTIALNAEEENKVHTAVIRNGTLSINVQNELPVAANLELEIISLKTSISQGSESYSQTIIYRPNRPRNRNSI
jgi:hypothetical protein